MLFRCAERAARARACLLYTSSEEAEENGMVSPETTTSLEGEAQAEQAPEPVAEESSPESAAESEKSTPSASTGPYNCSETCEQKARQAQADASDAVRIAVSYTHLDVYKRQVKGGTYDSK